MHNSSKKNLESHRPVRKKNRFSKFQIVFIFLQVAFVLVLLALWLSSSSIQESKNLWVLFFYSFPSEFLIAIVPHEPVLLYFGKFHPASTVTLVAVAGTLLTEALNYSVFKFVTDSNFFNKIIQKKTVGKVVNLFNKAPFAALWIAGFTPVPFYPFRFLVVMARYSRIKYLAAIFLSRTPRFFLIALLGNEIKFPDSLLALLFVALIASMNIPLLKKIIKKRKLKAKDAS